MVDTGPHIRVVTRMDAAAFACRRDKPSKDAESSSSHGLIGIAVAFNCPFDMNEHVCAR
jgi:hypothetical protein